MPMVVLEIKTFGSPASPTPKTFQLLLNSSFNRQMDSWQAIPPNALSRFGFRLSKVSGGAIELDPLTFEHFTLLAGDNLFFADIEDAPDPMFVGATGSGRIWPLLATSPETGDPSDDLMWKVIRLAGQETPSPFNDLPSGRGDSFVV